MPAQTWRQQIATQQAQGAALASFTTAKSVINPQAVAILPAGFFDAPGKSMTIRATGGLSNIVTTPGTIAFQVMLGQIIAFTTGNIQLNATAHTKLPWWLDIQLTCRAVGSGTSANLIGMGRLGGIMFTLTAAQVDATNVAGSFAVPASAPAVGTGFDSTAAQTLDFWAGFSISDPANLIQVETYTVSSDN